MKLKVVQLMGYVRGISEFKQTKKILKILGQPIFLIAYSYFQCESLFKMPLPMNITFKITRGYFKQPPSAFLLTDLQALAGAQNWSRCNVKTYKTLLLSRIPVHTERGC